MERICEEFAVSGEVVSLAEPHWYPRAMARRQHHSSLAARAGVSRR